MVDCYICLCNVKKIFISESCLFLLMILLLNFLGKIVRKFLMIKFDFFLIVVIYLFVFYFVVLI